MSKFVYYKSGSSPLVLPEKLIPKGPYYSYLGEFSDEATEDEISILLEPYLQIEREIKRELDDFFGTP